MLARSHSQSRLVDRPGPAKVLPARWGRHDDEFFSPVSFRRAVHRSSYTGSSISDTAVAAEHFCPCSSKRRADDADGGFFQCLAAWRETMARLLPPSSRNDRTDVGCARQNARNSHALIERAGKGHAIRFGAIHQRLAERAPGAGVDKFTTPSRDTGIARKRSTRRVAMPDKGRIEGGRFDDERGKLPVTSAAPRRRAGQRTGDVERADDQPHAVKAGSNGAGGIMMRQGVCCQAA